MGRRNEPYDPEHIEWLREYYPTHGAVETQKAFNEHFGLNLSLSSIKHRCQKNNIRVTYSTRFSKEHKPWNKGVSIKEERKDIYEKYFGRDTSYVHMGFIKRLPVGSISVRKDTNTRFIKVAEPNEWLPESRYIYEQHYGVKLGKDQRVFHLDGNSCNNDINNLIVVSNKIIIRLARKGLIFEDGELTRCAIAQQTLLQLIKDMENENTIHR